MTHQLPPSSCALKPSAHRRRGPSQMLGQRERMQTSRQIMNTLCVFSGSKISVLVYVDVGLQYQLLQASRQERAQRLAAQQVRKGYNKVV